jgi:hypothetical protein
MTTSTIDPPTTDSATTRERVLESLPVDPSLLESANIWFDRSWYGLLICGGATAFAAMATVGFLFLQYWSSGVRERHTEWRTSVLELKTAESNERAKKLELELAKIKQPRLISEDRLKSLAEKLKPFASTPFDLAFIPGDPEAAVFGTHIAAMLEMAGWKWVAWAPAGAPFQQVFTITGTDKPNIGQVGFFDVGIFLRPDDPDALAPPVQALIELLKGEGFAVAFETSTNPNINNKATVHITVGKKR